VWWSTDLYQTYAAPPELSRSGSETEVLLEPGVNEGPISYRELAKDSRFRHIAIMNFRKSVSVGSDVETMASNRGTVNKMCFFGSLALMVRYTAYSRSSSI
jgi:hypothetical protein